MKENQRMRPAMWAAAVILVITGIAYAISFMVPDNERNERAFGGDGKERIAASDAAKDERIAVNPSSIQEKPSMQSASLTTIDDIKREYGRVETVHLYGGKSHTGAVIATDGRNYTIVTLEGQVQVPMKDVKTRVIIR